ncbi:MAG: mechanosensitive ion channel family protein [Candidatus Aureabacteria bacterium]|nr:mechanosensitive ion channel family protein [Candidatus Auribacterota bacterium]
MNILYSNIIVILLEVILLTAIFVLINSVVRFIFKHLRSIKFLSKFENKFESYRRNIKGILILLNIALCMTVAGYNGFLLYKKKDLLAHTGELIMRIPSDFWLQFGLGIIKIILVVVAATYMIRIIRRVSNILMEKAKAYEQIKANNESIENFFTTLNNIFVNATWLLVLMLSSVLLPFPEVISSYLFIILKIYLIFSISHLIVFAVASIVDSLDALSRKYSSPDNLLRFYEHLRELVPLLKSCLEYTIYVYAATLIMLQLDFVDDLAHYGPKIIQIIGIFFLSRVFVEISNLFVDQFLERSTKLTADEYKKRITLFPIIRSFLKYAIYFFALVMVLKALEINIGPIIAGAGILGIVIGLGAQPLINDLVSGFFIIFENIYLVGDYIETSSARGIVETIDIRSTRIRNPNGQQHILRNGQIGDIVNFSKKYAFAVVEVGVDYGSDLEQVYKILHGSGIKLKNANPNILEKTIVQGLENFGESELLIRTITKVKPGCHMQVARDLRKIIKEDFDKAGIEIPFARRVIIFKNDDDKNKLKVQKKEKDRINFPDTPFTN